MYISALLLNLCYHVTDVTSTALLCLCTKREVSITLCVSLKHSKFEGIVPHRLRTVKDVLHCMELQLRDILML